MFKSNELPICRLHTNMPTSYYADVWEWLTGTDFNSAETANTN